MQTSPFHQGRIGPLHGYLVVTFMLFEVHDAIVKKRN